MFQTPLSMPQTPLEEQIIINVSPGETRVALLEHTQVAEIFIERHKHQSMVGSIYKGVVSRVLPGMNSAFVNIGQKKAAFLFGDDLMPPDLEHAEEDSSDKSPGLIQRLRDGQEIIIQITKESLGAKGPRATTYLTLAGRYLVLVPNVTHVGISRRIEDQQLRDELKVLVESIKPEHFGCIVRTAAVGVTHGELKQDLLYLTRVWESVHQKLYSAKAPSLIHSDLNLCEKILRDLVHPKTKKIVIDDEESFKRLRDFMDHFMPFAVSKLFLYDEPTPIFDVYGIEVDLARALASRVDLPSGGYLVIDQTEALTCLDVNTGKFVGKTNARYTILQTNLEAVVKVVEQLRIRNIGGIIVVDFIDMDMQEDRDKVYGALLFELKKDRAKTNVLKISELGLVQMTRKRTSQSLERQLQEPCSYCDGKGRVRSVESESFDLIREILRCSLQSGSKRIKVIVRPDIKNWLLQQELASLDDLIKKHDIHVEFANSALTMELLRELPYEVLPM